MASDLELSLDGLGADFNPAFGQLESGADFAWDFAGATSAFTAINDQPAAASTPSQTVSPRDLYRDPNASAPASTALTNLTSPDIDSPYLMDSFDTSPIYKPDGEINGSDQWFPLFPDTADKAPSADPIERSFSSHSFAQTSSSGNSPLVVDASASGSNGARRQSSTVPDKSPSDQQHSSVAGVKPRRRKGPLPPITVNDPSDKAAIKRARNTLAARDSRQRKLNHLSTLQQRIAELEEVNAALISERDEYKTCLLASGMSLPAVCTASESSQ